MALGGDVAEVELVAGHFLPDRPALVPAEAGVEHGGPYTALLQGVHLILHQRDEGRHDDAAAGAHQGRELVADGLAPAGGHHEERVPSLHHPPYNGLLMRTERLETEDGL